MKPKAFVPLILFILLLLFAGILAITQEAEDSIDKNDFSGENSAPQETAFEFEDGEPQPEWIPPGPPRWFHSNAGGMTLAETPSRLAALRSTYALVIDYAGPAEIDSRLLPLYHHDYTVEIRILYEQKKEYRRQWVFKDADGNIRLNAVFKPLLDEEPDELSERLLSGSFDDEFEAEDFEETLIENTEEIIEGETITEAIADLSLEIADDEGVPEAESPPPIAPNRDDILSVGFIELFNEKAQISEDRRLFEDDSEIIIVYVYNENTLISAETHEQLPGLLPVKMYTDNYRYNRSYSLRYVERRYHQAAEAEPVRLNFSNRVLAAAADNNFFSDKLFLGSDFFGNFPVGQNYRIIYDTDSRGRILIQTLLDGDDEVVWIITNTWSGDRVVASLKTEGEDEKLTEYEYDGAGNRIVQRDMHNGVLERLVLSDGKNETEELYMDGVLVLRALWEDGRKISEERVRRR